MKQERQLEVTDIKVCRWMDGERSSEQLERARDHRRGQHYGKMQKIAIETVRIYTERREDDFVGKRAIKMELPGRRRRGRPKRRWSDNRDEDLENIEEMTEDALYGEHWGRSTAAATPHQRGSSWKKQQKHTHTHTRARARARARVCVWRSAGVVAIMASSAKAVDSYVQAPFPPSSLSHG